MANADDIAIIALIVSLIALIITVVQLLQTVFGTAEGFRRTNKELMGVFAYSRDRVFHPTELRYETRFSTPHFTFHHPVNNDSLLSEVRNESKSGINSDRPYELAVEKTSFSDSTWEKPGTVMDSDHHQAPVRHVLAIDNRRDRINDLNSLIRSSSRISKLQRLLSWFERKSDHSVKHLVSPRFRAYASGWLILLEQLYDDSEKFHQNNTTAYYYYYRYGPGNAFDTGPDRRYVRYPAIECHERSWDLLPPDVVRPLASISMGDLLTLCFRLHMTVSDFRPREFSADGFGNNFSALQVQGLGMVLQYRYDRMKDDAEVDQQANNKFIPSVYTDKLAFGIIPANKQLGTEDWQLSGERGGQHVTELMRAHLRKIGVAESCLRIVNSSREPQPRFDVKEKERKTNFAGELFDQAVLLQAPFMCIDGLGITKYQPPIPEEWFRSQLRIREGRIILRNRLVEELSDTEKQAIAVTTRLTKPCSISKFSSTKRAWVAHVFEFFRSRYHDEYFRGVNVWATIEKNAPTSRSHDFLRQLRSAYTDADEYLASLFHQEKCTQTYTCLMAAHFDMAITVHNEVNTEVRDDVANQSKWSTWWTRPGYRDGTAQGHIALWKAEIVHRYVDHAMEKDTIVATYRKKVDELSESRGEKFESGAPADLTDEEIRTGWYVMMLRGCLWGMTHYPIWRPGLPYPSRYWNDNTLAFIA